MRAQVSSFWALASGLWLLNSGLQRLRWPPELRSLAFSRRVLGRWPPAASFYGDGIRRLASKTWLLSLGLQTLASELWALALALALRASVAGLWPPSAWSLRLGRQVVDCQKNRG